MNAQLGLEIVDGLLFLLLVLRLVVVKRQVERYRPPSPLPHTKTMTWEGLTVRRVS